MSDHRRTPPFLPFLDGPAVVAPKLRPISAENWLNPDTEADIWLREKHRLLEQKVDVVFQVAPSGEMPAREAATLINRAVGQSGDNFRLASQLTSDDLCVLVPGEAGYTLQAACLCAPTFWSLETHFGKSLGGLHHTVPGGDPELSGRITRIFDGLRPDLILERFNWTVQLGPERHTLSQQPMKDELAQLGLVEAAKDLHLRVERQTIRKLPTTGAVLFTIRICVDPLRAAVSTPDHRDAFIHAWQNTDEALAEYKGWPHYQPAVSAYFSN